MDPGRRSHSWNRKRVGGGDQIQVFVVDPHPHPSPLLPSSPQSTHEGWEEVLDSSVVLLSLLRTRVRDTSTLHSVTSRRGPVPVLRGHWIYSRGTPPHFRSWRVSGRVRSRRRDPTTEPVPELSRYFVRGGWTGGCHLYFPLARDCDPVLLSPSRSLSLPPLV